jgi:hypothetical protein
MVGNLLLHRLLRLGWLRRPDGGEFILAHTCS